MSLLTHVVRREDYKKFNSIFPNHPICTGNIIGQDIRFFTTRNPVHWDMFLCSYYIWLLMRGDEQWGRNPYSYFLPARELSGDKGHMLFTSRTDISDLILSI